MEENTSRKWKMFKLKQFMYKILVSKKDIILLQQLAYAQLIQYALKGYVVL